MYYVFDINYASHSTKPIVAMDSSCVCLAGSLTYILLLAWKPQSLNISSANNVCEILYKIPLLFN